MARAGIRRGVINFIAAPGRYRRVDRRLGAVLPGWSEGMPCYTSAWRRDTAAELVSIAEQHGISLACCAEGRALTDTVPGLRPASCGDYAWFAQLSGRMPQRPRVHVEVDPAVAACPTLTWAATVTGLAVTAVCTAMPARG